MARHNAHQMPETLELAKDLGAQALHLFLLVPVGCGVEIAPDQQIDADEYEACSIGCTTPRWMAASS